jgi:predicted TPR repeat methyltransferase
MPTELLWDEKTPKNSGVDLVVCSDSMLDGNLPENVADDVMKVLRPGGHFAFTIRECEREKYLKGIEKLEAYGDLKQVVHK